MIIPQEEQEEGDFDRREHSLDILIQGVGLMDSVWKTVSCTWKGQRSMGGWSGHRDGRGLLRRK